MEKLLKIVFLFETTFIFPQHSFAREVCMVCPASDLLNAYQLGFPAWCLGIFINGDFFQYFKRKLRYVNMQNLFQIRIFVISIPNCTLQLNFKAQFPVTRIPIFNVKSLIQATWRHLLPENFLNLKL